MNQWRAHSAWLLLTLLLVGGVIAPAVHQMQHDSSHARAITVTDDWRPHSEIDHTMQVDADAIDAHAFYCPLCHTQLVSELGRQAATPLPQRLDAALGITSSLIWGLSRFAPSLIRGPPATA